jgi:hypothetical protein
MWKEVFKAGKHTDANGNEREWSSEDIDTIISKYNNQMPDDKHEAPVVIGHPVNNSPAYAWVESLKKDGETLLAKFTQIDPEFEQLIKEGRYKKVSIALYPDMMLRHIGFLGAIPPAVKGLKDASFAEKSFCELIVDSGKWKVGRKLSMENVKLKVESLMKTKDENERIDTMKLLERDFFLNQEKDKQKLNTKEQMFNTCSTDVEQSGNKIQQIKLKEIKEKNIYSSPSKFDNFEGQKKPFSPNQKSIHFQGGNMPETPVSAKYSKLFQELLGWLGSTFNEEIANQTKEKLFELSEQLIVDSGEFQENEELRVKNEEIQESGKLERQLKTMNEKLQRKLELLEKDNRDMKFNDYFKSQLGRLVPAQKPIVKLAFEAIQDNKGFEFSENGNIVKMSGEDLIKRLIESFPMQIEFNEIAKKNAYSDSNDLEGQNKFIEEYYRNS